MSTAAPGVNRRPRAPAPVWLEATPRPGRVRRGAPLDGPLGGRPWDAGWASGGVAAAPWDPPAGAPARGGAERGLSRTPGEEGGPGPPPRRACCASPGSAGGPRRWRVPALPAGGTRRLRARRACAGAPKRAGESGAGPGDPPVISSGRRSQRVKARGSPARSPTGAGRSGEEGLAGGPGPLSCGPGRSPPGAARSSPGPNPLCAPRGLFTRLCKPGERARPRLVPRGRSSAPRPRPPGSACAGGAGGVSRRPGPRSCAGRVGPAGPSMTAGRGARPCPSP